MSVAQLAHYKLLDGLRGLAAQPVLLSHSCALFFAAEAASAPPVVGWLARLAVILFFVLSGFVICAGIAGEIRQTRRFDWAEFAIRRIARIYPPYLAAIAIVALFMGACGAAYPGYVTDAWSWLRAVVFLFRGNDAIALTPVWSLRLEVGLYVFAALAALIVLARGGTRIVLAAVTAALFALYCWKLSFGGVGAALFAAGGLAAVFFDWLAGLRPLGVAAAIVVALALPVPAPWLTDDSTLSMIYQALLGVPLALGLVALAHVRSVGRSPLVRLALASGGWSYTLYIIHMPIVAALALALPQAAGFVPRVAAIAAAMGIANGAAMLVARVVERPKVFAALIRRALMRDRAAARPVSGAPAALENSSPP